MVEYSVVETSQTVLRCDTHLSWECKTCSIDNGQKIGPSTMRKCLGRPMMACHQDPSTGQLLCPVVPLDTHSNCTDDRGGNGMGIGMRFSCGAYKIESDACLGGKRIP